MSRFSRVFNGSRERKAGDATPKGTKTVEGIDMSALAAALKPVIREAINEELKDRLEELELADDQHLRISDDLRLSCPRIKHAPAPRSSPIFFASKDDQGQGIRLRTAAQDISRTSAPGVASEECSAQSP